MINTLPYISGVLFAVSLVMFVAGRRYPTKSKKACVVEVAPADSVVEVNQTPAEVLEQKNKRYATRSEIGVLNLPKARREGQLAERIAGLNRWFPFRLTKKAALAQIEARFPEGYDVYAYHRETNRRFKEMPEITCFPQEKYKLIAESHLDEDETRGPIILGASPSIEEVLVADAPPVDVEKLAAAIAAETSTVEESPTHPMFWGNQ